MHSWNLQIQFNSSRKSTKGLPSFLICKCQSCIILASSTAPCTGATWSSPCETNLKKMSMILYSSNNHIKFLPQWGVDFRKKYYEKISKYRGEITHFFPRVLCAKENTR